MKLTPSSSAASLLAVAIFVGAAAGASAQNRRAASAESGDRVTVVACVTRQADLVRTTSPEAADATGPQFVLTDARSGSPSFSLTGLREQELTQHVGRRVEVTGTVERARTTPILTTVDGNRTGLVQSEQPAAAGVTPEGAAAHEPSDAVSATVQAGAVREPTEKTGDTTYQVATLPRLNAASFRPVEGTCAMPAPAAMRAAAGTPAPAQAAAKPPAAPPTAALQSITARGCLMRQTAGGTALTPQLGPGDRYVLTNASVAEAPRGTASAVPGSAPSGSGSGTVANSVGTSGVAPVDAAKLTYSLATRSGRLDELTQRVGEFVEVVGTLANNAGDARGAEAVARAQDTAHPSAPTQTITVATIRPLGGACK